MSARDLLLAKSKIEERRAELGIVVDPANYDELWKTDNPIRWLEIKAKNPKKYENK